MVICIIFQDIAGTEWTDFNNPISQINSIERDGANLLALELNSKS